MPARKTVEEINSVRETEQSANASAAPPKNERIFPIVGIGASAGGLAAFEAFFSGMPAIIDPGMAFVLVQHLAPDHKSLLTEIVSRYTHMQVFEVENGMIVKPNRVYVIPPKHDMALLNGALQLLEPSSNRGQRLPIDFFFHSLAQDQHERAICIVLSGTGSDGAGGLRAIKGEGGLVLAQNPESCEYDGMPGSAIATGLVDYILPPVEMPAQLISYVSHMFGKATDGSLHSMAKREKDEILDKIYGLLRSRTGHDFSQYKKNTIWRRIERRQAVHKISDLSDYLLFLQQTPGEVDALFNDLLIGVTSFFRDPEAFDVLATEVIPHLFADKLPGSVIRIWTCGCSTGEEAYSLAILIQEQMEALNLSFKVQLFATDIDSRAIEIARSGIYPSSIVNDVRPDRLTRFFAPEPDEKGFRINKNIRDMLIFSRHDVIGDPPFSRIDLISCRNLLIYVDGELQKRLIPLFHYSLNTNGILFLGTSESIGEFTNLFSTLNRQYKLYARKDSSIAGKLHLGKFLPRPEGVVAQRDQKQAQGDEAKLAPRELSERILLQKHTPVAVLVSERGEIIYLHGRTGRFLEFASGDIGVNILKSAREGLRYDLTVALHKAAAESATVFRPGLRVKTNGDFTSVNLTVEPVATGKTEPALYLVVLEDVPTAEEYSPVKMDTTTDQVNSLTADSRIALLTKELQAKEEYLHSANEELETSNEELKSANEEMQSLNEELQSTNEEMETSREELQSVNEELTTVNAELYTKVADLSRANNDMNNLLAGTGVGTVFVDHNLRIQRFTPAAAEVINLIQSDVGRPLGHVVSNLTGYNQMVEDVQDVLDTLSAKNIEVKTRSGIWFLMCIRPYRTLENDIDGAVITFTDISEQVKARDSLQRLAVLMKDGYDAITVQDLEGRILAWNPAAEKIYGWSEAEALAMNIRELIPAHLYEDHLKKVQALCRSSLLKPFGTQKIAKNGRVVEIFLTVTPLVNNSGQIYGIATTERETGVKREL